MNRAPAACSCLNPRNALTKPTNKRAVVAMPAVTERNNAWFKNFSRRSRRLTSSFSQAR